MDNSVHGQLGVELLAEEPETVAETGEVVAEVTAIRSQNYPYSVAE